MEETRLIHLDSVTVDNSLNPRVGALDQEAVLDYAAHIDDLPPMVVYFVPDENVHLLAAGFHRIAAHRLAGKTEACCIVRRGSRAEAAEYADLDNLRHGLQLSRAERREVIKRQLKRHPDWSDVRLAAACFTTDKTVRSVREALEQTSEIPRLDVLKGADGIERPRTVSRPPVGEASAKIEGGKLELSLGPLGDRPAETHRIGFDWPTPEPDLDDDKVYEAVGSKFRAPGLEYAEPEVVREVDPMPAAEDVKAQELLAQAEAPAPEPDRSELLAQLKAHQPAPPRPEVPAPAPAPPPAPIKLEMAPAADPDTVLTITLKPTGVCLISVTAEGRLPRLLSARREDLLARLVELLDPQPQPAEWLDAS